MEELNKEKMNRAAFLSKGALLVTGVSALAVGGGLLANKKAKAGNDLPNPKAVWPWPYPATGIDSALARIRAHDAYWSGKGCSYATFEGIIAGLRDVVGTPFTDMPTEMLIYGHGGGSGWGATCGTINGAAAAISLVCTKAVSDPMVSELYGWYTQTLLPSTTANTIGVNNGYGHTTYNMDLPQSLTNSPLCHVAVSSWCAQHNVPVNDNQRKERCARMCGDVAVKAIEMLNGYYASGSYTLEYVSPALNATCLACHGTGAMQDDVAAKMECSSCHGTDTYPHTGFKENEHLQFNVEQNFPNPFSDKTTVKFTLTSQENISVDVFSLSGQHITTLAGNKHYTPGTYTIEWNGESSSGSKADPGMYLFQLKTDTQIRIVNLIKL